jgi:hypothetical protein
LRRGLIKIGVKVWSAVLPGRLDGFVHIFSKDDKFRRCVIFLSGTKSHDIHFTHNADQNSWKRMGGQGRMDSPFEASLKF